MELTIEALAHFYPLANEFDPEELHDEIRSQAAKGYAARMKAHKVYENFPLSGEDEAKVDALFRVAFEASVAEAEGLRMLNAFFLSTGSPVGNEQVIKGHLYRVCTPGNPAVHLGVELPIDEDGITDADERRDWSASYSDSIVVD